MDVIDAMALSGTSGETIDNMFGDGCGDIVWWCIDGFGPGPIDASWKPTDYIRSWLILSVEEECLNLAALLGLNQEIEKL